MTIILGSIAFLVLVMVISNEKSRDSLLTILGLLLSFGFLALVLAVVVGGLWYILS